MGMRMMFTVFLLVVLATTVVSFTSDSAFDSRNVAANDKVSDMIALTARRTCCSRPTCRMEYPELCGGRR
uniref:Alpha-conotoxin SrIA/SrIB n=1 Tax=Conus spurius TaxID=192919 RepID=CA1AB_CONSP|nr:RecName: Full=Alpha-conotoxin SrIA/SrIB; Flags: Precursor [Conus spurius]